jgi:uncharacterized membrane protein
MKKLAIGCGIVVLVLGIVGAGAAYYLYRQVSSTVAQFAELGEIPDLERNVRNQAPFTPPASEELTDSQVQKLVQVQSEVRRRIGERIKEFEAKYKTLAEKNDANIADAPALLRAYGDIARTWLDAKRGQIEALNATGLSLDEYRWIRDQAYRALGQPFVDLDIAKIVDEARRGIASETAGQLRGSMGPAGPESNRALIERFKKELEENLALASFGL